MSEENRAPAEAAPASTAAERDSSRSVTHWSSPLFSRRSGDSRRTAPHRLFALADGVFAISMTLLALEVRIPDDVESFADGAHKFYSLFGIFLLAFVITGRFWLSNHWMLAKLHHIDDRVLELMIIFLAGICSLPVATTLLFRFGDDSGAVSFAAGLLGVTSLFSARLWWYVSEPARDLCEIDRDVRRGTMFNQIFNGVIFLLAIPLAYLVPQISDHSASFATFVWLLLPTDDLFRKLLPARWWR